MIIACIGAAVIDKKARATQPLVMQTKNQVQSFYSWGGVARNIAESLARLQIPVMFCSRIGKDPYGAQLLDSLQGLGVNVSLVSQAPHLPTAAYTALLDYDGEMKIAFSETQIYEEDFSPEILKDELPKLSQADFWVVDTNLTQESLRFLAENRPPGKQLWAVGVSVAKVQRLLSILKYFDGLVLNKAELHAMTPWAPSLLEDRDLEARCNALLAQGLSSIVVTLGRQGVIMVTPREGLRTFAISGNARGNAPNNALREVKDTTGAGDALAAGIFCGLYLGFSLSESIPFGIKAASLALQTQASVSEKLTREAIFSGIAPPDISC